MGLMSWKEFEIGVFLDVVIGLVQGEISRTQNKCACILIHKQKQPL
jgi:hypothetical protein